MDVDHSRLTANTPAERDILRKAAKQAYKDKTVGRAIEIYERLLSSIPADEDRAATAADRTAFAAALASNSRLAEAAFQLEQVVAFKSDDAKARYKLAQILSRLGRHSDAVEQLEQAIAVEPSDADSYVRLAVEYRALAREGDARRALDKALALDPEHAEAQLLQLDAALLSPERRMREDDAQEGGRPQDETARRTDGPPPWKGKGLRREASTIQHTLPVIVFEAVALLLLSIWLRSAFT